MATLIETLTGWRRITVPETDRAILLADGRFRAIPGPGNAWVGRGQVVEMHSLSRPAFTSAHDAALFRERPDLAKPHLTDAHPF